MIGAIAGAFALPNPAVTHDKWQLIAIGAGAGLGVPMAYWDILIDPLAIGMWLSIACCIAAAIVAGRQMSAVRASRLDTSLPD